MLQIGPPATLSSARPKLHHSPCDGVRDHSDHPHSFSGSQHGSDSDNRRPRSPGSDSSDSGVHSAQSKSPPLSFAGGQHGSDTSSVHNVNSDNMDDLDDDYSTVLVKEDVDDVYTTDSPASFEDDEAVRIVLVGKTGAGKSATGNTILRQKVFESKRSPGSVTEECQKKRGVVDSRNISVIDTPGFFDTRFSKDEVHNEVNQCLYFAAPGPHALLHVIKLDRFTEEDKKTVEMVQEKFGPMSAKYTMPLFTGVDQFEEGESVETFLENSPELQQLVSKCDGRYHVFNNKSKDPSQVTELLEKINNMVLKNGGSHYSSKMFEDAEREIEEKKQRILKETEGERLKVEEELNKRIEREALEKTRKMVEEQQAQEARAAREMEERTRKDMEELKKKHEREALANKEKLEGLKDQLQKERFAREMEKKQRNEKKELKKKQKREALENKEKMEKQRQEKQAIIDEETRAREREEKGFFTRLWNQLCRGIAEIWDECKGLIIGAGIGFVLGGVTGACIGIKVGSAVGGAAAIGAAIGTVVGEALGLGAGEVHLLMNRDKGGKED